MSDNADTLMFYFKEFRRRLLYCMLVLMVFFLLFFSFANQLYSLLALPLLKHLPHGQKLIATHMLSPVFVPFELSFFTALYAVMPFVIYQIWQFIAPALYAAEKNKIWPLLLLSIFLFYLGSAFAYCIVFPLLFTFLAKTTPASVILSPDIGQYLDFSLKLLLLAGLIFEVPVITLIFILTGIVKRATLIRLRPYAIVSAFALGMLLSPPDVVSQTLLAIPLWLLFEIGLIAAYFIEVKENYARGRD